MRLTISASEAWSASVTTSKRPFGSDRAPLANASASIAPDSRATSTAISRNGLGTAAADEREPPDQTKRLVLSRLLEQADSVDDEGRRTVRGGDAFERRAQSGRLRSIEAGGERHVESPLFEHIRIAPAAQQLQLPRCEGLLPSPGELLLARRSSKGIEAPHAGGRQC